MRHPSINPLRFAVLLPVLLVAHNVADHVVQTDHQAAEKAGNWGAMAGHVGGYQATQLLATEAVLTVSGLRGSWQPRLAGALVSAVTHAVLDRRWPVKRILELTRSPQFARMTTPVNGMYQADQALHHGCLLIAALIMSFR